MKRILLFVIVLAVLASCSTPQKYSYHFDHHKYQSVKKDPVQSKVTQELVAVEVEAQQADLKVSSGELVAASDAPAVAVKNPIIEKAGQLAAKYKNLRQSESKSEKKVIRKELRHDLKDIQKDLKKYVKERKDNPDSKGSFRDLDKHLRIAIVFGIAAIVASVIFYPVGGPGLWYLPSILWLVAIIFLILWLVDQA